MKTKYFLFITLAIVFGVNQVEANVASVNPRPRMLSMGGAGLATLGDKDSAMINPAGLADVETSKLQVLPLLVEVPFEMDMLSSYLDYKDAIDASGATSAQKQAALQTFLGEVGAAALAVRTNLYPSFTTKYMHFGLLVDVYGEPKLRMGGITANQAVDSSNTSGTLGLVLGGGYSFLDKQLEVGVTIKPMYRFGFVANNSQTLYDIVKGGNANTNISTQVFGENATDNRAYGLGMDLGVKYFIPYFEDFKPSVGLTVQDVGNTRFIGDTETPSDISQSVSLGVAVHPNYSIFRNTFAIDLRNILDEAEFLNKLHIGAESVIWNMLALRMGISQGYITGGVGVLLKILEIEAFIANREASKHAHNQDITTVGFQISLGW